MCVGVGGGGGDVFLMLLSLVSCWLEGRAEFMERRVVVMP